MKLISDLHMHSKFSRGCSKNLDIKNIEHYGRIKGVGLVGTGDFTHPEWIKELKSSLTDNGEGIFLTKTGFRFALQTEISLIYSQAGKGRRIHNVLLAPNFEVVDQITEYLLKFGRIDYDGRPIFKIPCPQLVEDLKKISEKIEIIPAHIWTPHFSLFGEYNQFSKVEECFEDQTKNIFAMETGLSSDPPMNWKVKNLDRYNLVSFSDSHSYWPWRLGREATIFDINESYDSLIKAIRTGTGLVETIEVDPNFGKYHLTGHRNCEVCMYPKASKKVEKICPKCKGKLTVGVLERVEELEDRKIEEGKIPQGKKPFKKMIPLSEILAILLKSSVATKKVWAEYYKLVNLKEGRTEYDVLLNLSKEELEKLTIPKIAETIIANREGKIKIKPGYDGLYGVPLIK